MQRHQIGNISWRDKIFVSIGEAAEVLSRSPEWVRNRVGEGSIEGRRYAPGGPVMVTVASLLAFAEQTERATSRPTERRLRLVVDNDARN